MTLEQALARIQELEQLVDELKDELNKAQNMSVQDATRKILENREQ